MERDRWEQIERLYHAALRHEPDAREAFLDEACAGDKDLRREVAGLLGCDIPCDSFIQSPEIGIASEGLATEPLPENQSREKTNRPATLRLGDYHLLSPLGRGGMGEVYLALDTRLGRYVAIKLLPAAFTSDVARVQRFAREARAASALNHPNIITIHEIGEATTDTGITHYIVTEYVEGETLRHRMTSAPQQKIEPLEAVEIALQIAAALSAAHEAGITHRDIKPENVMIRPDGYVKVLDFGLAKLSEPLSPAPNSVDVAQAPTLVRDYNTKSGVLMGTPRYMSPEQVRGERVDARTDIFSLGVLLYEMVDAQPPFVGATTSDVIAAILRDDPPPLTEDLPDAPPELERIIDKALRKERAERYQTAKELIADLKELKQQIELDEKLAGGNRQTAHANTRKTIYSDPLPADAATPSFVTKAFSTLRQSGRTAIISGIVIILLSLGVLRWSGWWAPMSYFPSPQAKRYYDEGLNALRDGAYHKASKFFEEVIGIDGDYAIPHARLAEAWMELDYTDKANFELRRAYTLAPSRMAPIDQFYIQALNLTIDHKFAAAVEKYRAIAEQTPEGEKAYAQLDLGRAFERNEEIEQAINYYKQAKQIDPRYATAPLRLGILYGRLQEYDKATAEFDQAKNDYEALANPEGLNELLFQRGVLFGRRGQTREARESLQLAHEKARDNKNLYQQVAVLLQLSLIFYTEGKTVIAQERAQEALGIARANGLETLTTQGLIDLGNVFYQRREYEEAERRFNQAIESAQATKRRRAEAMARLSLGRLFVQQYIKMGEAQRHLEQALAFFEKGGYRNESAETISLLGRAKLQEGNYQGALDIFDEQLRRVRQMKDQPQLARLYSLIGRTLADQDDYPEALRHFEESHLLYQSLGRQLYIGYALLDRSDLLWQLGRYGEARNLLNQVPSVAERLDSGYKQILLARNHLFSSRLALSERRFSEAIEQSKQALAMSGTFKRTMIEANMVLGLASVFLGKKTEGRSFCKRAVELSPQENDPRLYSTALLALAEAELESGNATVAQTVARQAQVRFARAGQPESEWRASLIESRASFLRKDYESALVSKRRANNSLSQLSRKWGQMFASGYLARRDIQFYLKHLNGILANKQ